MEIVQFVSVIADRYAVIAGLILIVSLAMTLSALVGQIRRVNNNNDESKE